MKLKIICLAILSEIPSKLSNYKVKYLVFNQNLLMTAKYTTLKYKIKRRRSLSIIRDLGTVELMKNPAGTNLVCGIRFWSTLEELITWKLCHLA